jgi:hypothetical protein
MQNWIGWWRASGFRRRFAAAPSHAIRLLVAKPPCPSGRPAALRRERASEPVGPDGMRRKPGHRRREAAPHRMGKHSRWKNVRQRLVEPRQRLPVNFVTPFRHAGPPFPGSRHSRGGVKVSSTARELKTGRALVARERF